MQLLKTSLCLSTYALILNRKNLIVIIFLNACQRVFVCLCVSSRSKSLTHTRPPVEHWDTIELQLCIVAFLFYFVLFSRGLKKNTLYMFRRKVGFLNCEVFILTHSKVFCFFIDAILLYKASDFFLFFSTSTVNIFQLTQSMTQLFLFFF